MIHSNEALSYAIYMANRWSKEECCYVFNGYTDVNNPKYKHSIGEHIWNKYLDYYITYGVLGASMKLLYELDSTNLELLLNRACELYDGRKNKE